MRNNVLLKGPQLICNSQYHIESNGYFADVLDAAAYTDGEYLLEGRAVRAMRQELTRLTLWDSVRTTHPT